MRFLNRAVAAALPLLPKAAIRPFARPYIAGKTVADLVAVGGGLARQGYRLALSQLGEFVTDREQAEEAARVYREVLDEVERAALPAYIHVKTTQLGITFDPDLCRRLVVGLLEHARDRGGVFVRMDMEDSPRIEPTLSLYRGLRAEWPKELGVVIQARMRRSLEDVREIAPHRTPVRLCKGVYLEPHELAFTDPELIRDNFLTLLGELLEAGCRVGIATHDEWVIYHACRLVERLRLGPDDYEFQMLHGVRPRLREIVKDAGHPVRIGVPFGPEWLPYSLRRLRKNPDIAGHVMRAVFARG